MKYFLDLISIILGAGAQYLLKVGMNSGIVYTNDIGNTIRKILTNPYIQCGAILYALSMFCWLYVLSVMELSKAYPMVSLGYVFTLFLGFSFLNESLSMSKIVGILLIIVGVFFINR